MRALRFRFSPVRVHLRTCPQSFHFRYNHVAVKRDVDEILDTVKNLEGRSSYLETLVNLAKVSRSKPSTEVSLLAADPRLSELVSLLLATTFDDLSPQVLANLLSSLAILQFKNPQLMEKYITALQAQLPHCKLNEITMILTAITKLEFKSTELLKSVANRIVELQSSLSPNDIIVILNCFAVFGAKHTKLLDALSQATQIHALGGEFTSRQLSSILPAFGVFEYWNPGLINHLREAILTVASNGKFEAPELVRIFKSLMYFRVKGEELAEALCKHALTLADEMTPSDICGMWLVMGQHMFKNPQFVPVFTDRALQAAQRFTLSEVTGLLVSLSVIKEKGRPPSAALVRRLCDVLLPRVHELATFDILSCLNAMAGLELRERMDLIEALGAEAKSRSREFSMAQGKQILEILQYLASTPAVEDTPEPPKILRTDFPEDKRT